MSHRTSVTCARISAIYLLGGLALGLGLALPVNAVPIHAPQTIKTVLSGVVMLTALTFAGVGWGRALGRRYGWTDSRKAGRAAGFAFGPTLLVVAILLALLEPLVLEAAGFPIHVVFTLMFVPAAFLVAAVSTGAVVATVADRRHALRAAVQTGAGAAAGFLIANVLMDLMGWRVGAPGAAERATMLTVSLVGTLAAALAGGAVLGVALDRVGRQAEAGNSDR